MDLRLSEVYPDSGSGEAFLEGCLFAGARFPVSSSLSDGFACLDLGGDREREGRRESDRGRGERRLGGDPLSRLSGRGDRLLTGERERGCLIRLRLRLPSLALLGLCL